MRNATLISRFVAAIGISGERTGDDPKVIDVPGNEDSHNPEKTITFFWQRQMKELIVNMILSFLKFLMKNMIQRKTSKTP